MDYIPELVIASLTYTDGICDLCQKAMENHYGKDFDQLLDEAAEMRMEQKKEDLV
jgi:hypothetical protein